MTEHAKLLPLSDTLAATSGDPLVAEVMNAKHPTLTGRALLRWQARSGVQETWVAALRGLSIRTGDRVLVIQPSNWDEPLIVGVIDGFARRPRPSREHAATIDLLPDQAVCVRDGQGRPLVEVAQAETGVELRLLSERTAFELDGELAIAAKSVNIRAREGEAKLTASDDVVIEGENVHLN